MNNPERVGYFDQAYHAHTFKGENLSDWHLITAMAKEITEDQLEKICSTLIQKTGLDAIDLTDPISTLITALEATSRLTLAKKATEKKINILTRQLEWVKEFDPATEPLVDFKKLEDSIINTLDNARQNLNDLKEYEEETRS